MANGPDPFRSSSGGCICCVGLRSIRDKLLHQADSDFHSLWRGRRRRPDHAAARAETNGENETASCDRKSSGSRPLFKTRPYNVLTDFSFVSMTARFEMLLATKADSSLKTLQDVVTAARKDPGKLNFGAINPGSTQNLSAHLLKQVTGIDVTIVPYKTTPDLVTAVLRGDVDVGFDFYAGLQAVISDNQVRIIATSGEQRNPLLRDVPTAKESGFPEYIVTSWNGLAAKAGMPAENAQ